MCAVLCQAVAENETLGVKLLSMLRRLFFGLFLVAELFSCLQGHAQSGAKTGDAPNIMLITLDSTRADRMSFLGAKHLTPNIDQLAAQGLVFERAYAQAPLTIVSHASLLSGTYPQTNLASEFGAPLATSVPYLPELLHGNGYHTAAFVNTRLLDPKNGFAPGFERGFDIYDTGKSSSTAANDEYHGSSPGTNEVVARVIRWTSTQRGPYFVWVCLSGPDGSRGEKSYNAAVTSLDAAVGGLLAALKKQQSFDNALVVLAADHGESLGAHGEETHGVFLYDEAIHVPLLLKLPQNQMAGSRVSGRVRLLDIAPSILEVARVPVPSQMQGQSLLRLAKSNPAADQPVYSRNDFSQQAFGWSRLESWRSGKYLYIRAPHPELYDLSTDPLAMNDISGKSRAILQTLASQLENFDSRLKSGVRTANAASLTSSDMQKLASLGYIGLQKTYPPVSATPTGINPKDVIDIANKTLSAWRSLYNADDTGATSTVFQKLIAAGQKGFLIDWGLGVSLARKKQYMDAIKQLHAAVQLQPDVAWLHYDIANCLMKTGDFKTAIVHLEIASHLLPLSSSIHSALTQAQGHMAILKQPDSR